MYSTGCENQEMSLYKRTYLNYVRPFPFLRIPRPRNGPGMFWINYALESGGQWVDLLEIFLAANEGFYSAERLDLIIMQHGDLPMTRSLTVPSVL